MRELLEKWAALARQRCEETKHQPGYFGIAGSFEIGRRVWVPKGSAVSLADAGLILAATIEAIEVRGWSWELRGSGCPSFARVTAVKSHSCIADEPTDSPAFPLLAAYLAALEAEAGS